MTVVNVLSGGAAAAVVKGAQEYFERASGARVNGTFSAVGQMRDQLLAGTPCDLVILTRPRKALGLDQALQPALRPFPNGATAMARMARSQALHVIGCTQETEINYTPGVTLVGSLPQEFELATDYTLGVCTGAREPQLARQLAQLVAGPASEAIRRQGGFAF